MTTTYTQAKCVVTIDVGVYVLLLQKKSEEFFALDQVATVIWRGINLNREPNRLRELVSQHFSSLPEPNELDKKITGFIKSLLEHGLVEITPHKSTSNTKLPIYKSHNLPPFVEPSMKNIPRDWLEANRPETYYRIMWGGAHQDNWNPSGSCPN